MIKIDMTREYHKRTNTLLHLYNRGNRKGEICRDIKDYIAFFDLIKYLFHINEFDLLCFALMPNHYHILAIQQGDIHISQVMQMLGCIYTKYFNKKYSLCGHLFQGSYKSKIITNLYQLKIVTKYILENPLEIKLPDHYPYLYSNEYLIDQYLLSFTEDNEELTL